MPRRLSAVCGSREYTINADRLRTTTARNARFHPPVHPSSGNRMYIPGRSFQLGGCASTTAVSGRRLDMQHRPEGRTGPRLASGYAMCFHCEHDGPAICLQGHDQAHWRRYRCDKRWNAVLGCLCAKQPSRPRHAERKLRRCQRQRCLRPGRGRQDSDRWISPHDNVAAIVGRRPDRT
jgi:hypothetical protein